MRKTEFHHKGRVHQLKKRNHAMHNLRNYLLATLLLLCMFGCSSPIQLSNDQNADKIVENSIKKSIEYAEENDRAQIFLFRAKSCFLVIGHIQSEVAKNSFFTRISPNHREFCIVDALKIGALRSVSERSKDINTAAKLKTAILDSAHVDKTTYLKVKVFVFHRTAVLMGSVSKQEGKTAGLLVSNFAGDWVDDVRLFFEYTDQ
jgi:hypothetical protein